MRKKSLFLTALTTLASALGVQSAAGETPAAVAEKNLPASALFQITRSGKVDAARPIYLIPGTAAPGAAWDPVRPALEGNHEVRTLSLAGFAGLPAQPFEGNFVEAQAKALAAHLKASKVKGAVLIGHSLGGQVALLAAIEAGDAVGGVIVVDSVPFNAQWLSFGQVQTVEQAQVMAAATQAGLQAGDWSAAVARMKAGFGMQSRDAKFYPQLEEWLLASDQKTTAAALGDLLRLDLRQRMADVKQPTLVLMSYDKAFMQRSNEEWLAAAAAQYYELPRGQVGLIEDSRHWIMQDQPRVLLAAIERFLGQIR